MKFFCVLFFANFLFQTSSYSKENGLLGEYYNSTNFKDKVYTRIDKELNFSFIGRSPAPGVNTEYYSIRWSGELLAPETGEYEFIVHVDDGLKLWVGGEKIIDSWIEQPSATYSASIKLKAGKLYPIKIEYFNGPDHTVMQLSWKSPEDKSSTFFGLIDTTPEKIIPSKYFFSTMPREEKKGQEVLPTTAVLKTVESKELSVNIPQRKKIKAPELSRSPARLIKKEHDVFVDLTPGKTFILNNILFKQSSYLLLEQSYQELDKLFYTLEENPTLKIEIAGHTENVGDERLNKTLSLQRAQVIASYLTRKGINSSRLQTFGYGSSEPIVAEPDAADRPKNRRVEFKVKE